MLKLFITSLLLKLLDILTTIYSIIKYRFAEINPFVTHLINSFGLISGLIINSCLYFILIGFLFKNKKKDLLIISIVLMAIVVLINSVDIIIGLIFGVQFMPLYEFKCEKCKKKIEVIQKIDDPNPKCCDQEMKKSIGLSNFVLKGDGWFRDGYSKTKSKIKKNKNE